MNRATVLQGRQSIEAATTFVKHGIRFVAVPCATDEDYAELVEKSKDALESMAVEMEKEEASKC